MRDRNRERDRAYTLELKKGSTRLPFSIGSLQESKIYTELKNLLLTLIV